MDPVSVMSGIYIYDNVLSESECDSLINNIHGVNQPMNLQYINNIIEKRCNLPNSIYQKDELVSMDHYNTQFWYYDNILPDWKATKREKGGHLRRHFDSVYIKSLNEKSIFTIMIYLSDTDGDLKFGNITITPKKGRMVVFDLVHEHEALPNNNGTKYFIRSKIMYHRGDNIGTETDKKALEIYLNSIKMREINNLEADELENKAFSMSPILEKTVLCLYGL
jgi:hypothetical protein